ncbi:accessory gene regulator B family protein [Clostridium sp. D2Q-11]|uniref:Accessory gene regulator B family protein n=1 Tax=Anaeromonas frigoriresistens TaxID=2683708 RepID=A0A942V1G6_9FIRM|nr:accessory gene regulator B family protein [Anaeromonas frigoriresistens]MBS4540136.1 accessory gene regulator B family protein [Anaeromonas frigoriresistens]
MKLIKRVSLYLTNQITADKEYTSLEVIKIKYGLECILSELSKFILYLAVFSFLNLTKEFIVATLFFSILRIFTGGFHQKTYFGCLLTSFVILLLIIKIPYIINIEYISKLTLIFLAYTLIIIFAPMDHPNKPIPSLKRRRQLKIVSIFLYSFLLLIVVNLPNTFSNIGLVALFIQSLTLLLGKIKLKKSQHT